MTPLAQVFHTPDKVTTSYLTSCICELVTALGLDLGFLPSEVSAWCLRAAGATALHLAQVDPDVIRLIGRWHSDKMRWYLHVQAYLLMRNYSHCMLLASTYALIPNHLVPRGRALLCFLPYPSFFLSPTQPPILSWPVVDHGTNHYS
jgi:hypothetical protein